MSQDSNRMRPLVVSPFARILMAIACLTQVSATVAQPAMQPDAFLVQTTSGPLQGFARPDGGAEFFGIPYAQPPVGDLRWHEPMPVKPWSEIHRQHLRRSLRAAVHGRLEPSRR